MKQTTAIWDDDWLMISGYSRSRAIADGVLVAADPAMASEAGWKYPVAYTNAVHAAVIAWSEGTETDKGVFTGQDQAGREWDVLSMAARGARRADAGAERLVFTMVAVPPTGECVEAVEVDLAVYVGPGDTPEPVITIMLPGED